MGHNFRVYGNQVTGDECRGVEFYNGDNEADAMKAYLDNKSTCAFIALEDRSNCK